MKRRLHNILLTGGAGFIGSNFVHTVLAKYEFTGRVINLDLLTYAGNLDKLKGLPQELEGERYFFEQADICDKDKVTSILEKYEIDTVVHMAAESHVDRSIESPFDFLKTNIIGTYTLLQCVREYWGNREDVLFHHVSTDEVYGSLGETGYFTESTGYDPRSPYSASKASSDHFVRAYYHTYSTPVTISNCSNNYGPRQDKEKLIPLMISNMVAKKNLPVYGKGENVRDWIFVDDHNEGLWAILNRGKLGETYNLGGNNEVKNIDMVNLLCEKVATSLGIKTEENKQLITYVTDRLGHDFRYAIDNNKAKNDLGWSPVTSFENGIDMTIQWYLNE